MKRLVVCVLLLACAVAAAQETKLIMGFETDEIAAKKGKAWCELVKGENGCEFWAHFEFDTPNSRAWTWRCQSGDATEGTQALVARARPGRRQTSFERTPFQQRFYPVLRESSEASVVLTTFQWLAYAPADLRDWSGFDLLRVDVKSDRRVALRIEIEDELIEPPVLAQFDCPDGDWQTLELDLRAAARVRGLDLKRMTNVYLLASPDDDTRLRVDNLRLVKAGAANKFAVRGDATPMDVKAPAFPAVPASPALPEDFKYDRSPVALEPAAKVVDGTLAPVGWVAAVDNRFLLVGYTKRRGAGPVGMVQSGDGGKTWEDLAVPVLANLDHGTARGSVVDGRDVVTATSGLGCAGVGIPTPRIHANRVTFTGAGWERERGTSIIDYDIRHCGSTAFVVRVPAGAHKGRLWATWGSLDRMRRLVVRCQYSDDDGRTWWHTGPSATVPGSEDSPFSFNTYGYQQPRVAPFRGEAAVFWQDAKGLRWSRFDGKTWSDAETIDPDAKAKSAVCENESFRVPGSVVTLGDDQVFLTAWDRGGVYHYDGKSWRRELEKADDAGVLTICGGRDVMLITSGHSTEPPPTVKTIRVTREASVLCWRRKADGAWAEPLDLAGGVTTVFEYRKITAVVVPATSPENFAPVAFSDGSVVKLVKVPALGSGAK